MDQYIFLARLYASQLNPDDQLRLDAADLTAGFAKQFEFVETQLAETKFAPLKSETFLYFDDSAPAGSSTILHRTVTHVGHADWVDENATDLPNADVATREDWVPVDNLGVQYRWNVKDVKRASIDPTARLDVERKKSAIKAVDRKHDEAAAIGSAKHGRTGFINSAAVPLVTPITGAWDATTTAQEMIDDVLACLNNIPLATEENYEGTDVVLPTEQYRLINTKPYGVDANMTVRKWLIDNIDGLARISSWNRLAGAGAGATDRMMAFHKDQEVAKYNRVSAFEEEAPQRRGLAFIVPCHGECGWTEIRIPGAVAYMDGI